MHRNRPVPKHTLARNLRFLMDRYGYSEAEVARMASVSQKTVNNMLNMRSGAKLDMVDQIAHVFGLNLWHMIMPALPDEYPRLADLDALMENWHNAGDQGKEMIQMIADREASYSKSSNDK